MNTSIDVPNEIKIPKFSLEKDFMQEKWINEHYPEFHEWIYLKYPKIDNWFEKLYLFYNGMDTPPKCANPNCKTGNYPTFKGLYKGYLLYCCRECYLEDLPVKKKKELIDKSDLIIKINPNGERVCRCTHPFECENWQTCSHEFTIGKYCLYQRLENNNELCTILRPYGTRDMSKAKRDAFLKKDTLVIGYSIDDPDIRICSCTHENECKLWSVCEHSFEIKSSTMHGRKRNNLELCTILNPLNSSISKTLEENFENKNKDWLVGHTNDGDWIHVCTHPEECDKWNECDHTFIINRPLCISRKQNGDELCTILNDPKNKQVSESEKLIRRIVEYLGVECDYNVRNVIFNETTNRWLELDVLQKIPSGNRTHRIAIEFNGSYTHSMTNSKTKRNQHITKAIKCAEKGIELITVWEDTPKELIYYFLRDKFEGKDVSVYKELLHPDLKYDEWSNDLGWYNDTPPNPENILEHFCYHFDPMYLNKCFPCYDSGKIIKETSKNSPEPLYF